jgi:hypothetical protein
MQRTIIKGISIIIIASFLIIPSIQSKSMNSEIELDTQIKQQSTSSFGYNRYGIVLVNFTSAEGIPDENFQGMLTDINVTFNGTTQLMIFHFLFPLKSALVFETCNALNVHIDSFYGWVAYNENVSIVYGFSWRIYWREL